MFVDNKDMGITPVNVELLRNQPHTFVVKMDGYEDASATTETELSGWLWGNIIFGGIIGLAVDFASGGAHNITPATVSVTLVQSSVGP